MVDLHLVVLVVGPRHDAVHRIPVHQALGAHRNSSAVLAAGLDHGRLQPEVLNDVEQGVVRQVPAVVGGPP